MKMKILSAINERQKTPAASHMKKPRTAVDTNRRWHTTAPSPRIHTGCARAHAHQGHSEPSLAYKGKRQWSVRSSVRTETRFTPCAIMISDESQHQPQPCAATRCAMSWKLFVVLWRTRCEVAGGRETTTTSRSTLPVARTWTVSCIAVSCVVARNTTSANESRTQRPKTLPVHMHTPNTSRHEADNGGVRTGTHRNIRHCCKPTRVNTMLAQDFLYRSAANSHQVKYTSPVTRRRGRASCACAASGWRFRATGPWCACSPATPSPRPAPPWTAPRTCCADGASSCARSAPAPRAAHRSSAAATGTTPFESPSWSESGLQSLQQAAPSVSAFTRLLVHWCWGEVGKLMTAPLGGQRTARATIPAAQRRWHCKQVRRSWC